MGFEYEIREAARLLDAVENGTTDMIGARPRFADADPALVYLLFAWLRSRYAAGHPASEGVLGRIVTLCGSPAVARAVREGEHDAVVQWFRDTHDYRELDRDQFLAIIVEKLEG